MKKDTIKFDTKKSVQEIKDVLRSVNCQLKTPDDPLGSVGDPPAVISVLMYGKADLLDKIKSLGGRSNWAVEVYVYDFGNRRQVEMVALGESSWEAAKNAYRKAGDIFEYGDLANQYIDMNFSKRHRNQIEQMLR